MKSVKITLSVFLFSIIASSAFAGNGDTESAAAPGQSSSPQKIICEARCVNGGPFVNGTINRPVYAVSTDAVAAFSNIDQQCQQLAVAGKTKTRMLLVQEYREASIQRSCFLESDLQTAPPQ